MRKLKQTLKQIDSVDIVLITAFGLYMVLLISNLSKIIN